MSDDTFVFTPEMDDVSNQLWAITSAVGAGLCFLVLLVMGSAWLHPVARPFLDRVSFRILVCALISNTIFGVASTVGGLLTAPSFLCGFSIFVLQLTLELSSFLTFCIALNMQLVIVHHVDGRRLEKYYLLGSLLLAVCLTVPPYALKQYGWDPLSQDCWYSNDNVRERIGWQIGTQLFWTVLTVVGEIFASATVAIYMWRYQMWYKRRMRSISNGSQGTSGSATIDSKEREARLVAPYRGIILRIGLYPLASIIVNGISVATVTNTTVHGGVHSLTGYHILLFSDFLYGGRAVVYGLLAATDPSLIRALRALKDHYFSARGLSSRDHKASFSRRSVCNTGTSVQVHIELSTITDDNDAPSPRTDSGVDMESQKTPRLGHAEDRSVEDNVLNIGFGKEPPLDGEQDMERQRRALMLRQTVQRRQDALAAREAAQDAFSRKI